MPERWLKIDEEWIEPLAMHLVSRSHSEPVWDRRNATVLASEKVTLFGLTIIPRRRVRYAHMDPVAARKLFLQHALVEGDYDTKAPFFAPTPACEKKPRSWPPRPAAAT